MKCTKCGFVSFDHLSECRKCGTSLTQCRDSLGFSGARLNVPFFLGSLLKDYVKPSADEENNLTAAGSNPSFDLGLGDRLDLAGSRPTAVTNPEQPIAPASKVLEPDDFNLLDISDEELDILIANEENGAGLSPSPGPAGGPGEGVVHECAADEGFAVDLSDKELEDFLSEFDDFPDLAQDAGDSAAGRKTEKG